MFSVDHYVETVVVAEKITVTREEKRKGRKGKNHPGFDDMPNVVDRGEMSNLNLLIFLSLWIRSLDSNGFSWGNS